MTDCAFISLGTHCYPAWLMQNTGITTAAMPFDWLCSDPGMVADCIEDGFRSLFNPSLLVPFDVYEGVQRHGHKIYSRKWGRPMIFQHHDPTTRVGARYFSAAVDRFNEVMDSTSPKLFVLLVGKERAAGATLNRLATTLHSRTRNGLLLSIIRENKDAVLATPKVTLISSTLDDVRYSFTETSNMRSGLSYENKHDDDAIRDLILSTSKLVLRHSEPTYGRVDDCASGGAAYCQRDRAA